MAEISTIGRPYAEALSKAVKDSKSAGLADSVLSVLGMLDDIIADPQLKAVSSDPSLTNGQVYSLIRSMLPDDIPEEADQLLKLVIENGRLEALPQISSQFKALLDKERGEAEVLIESPYELNKRQLDELVQALSKKFSNLKLNPVVVIDKSLIGGVRVSVGDKVLDGTVKARLAEMRAALTS